MLQQQLPARSIPRRTRTAMAILLALIASAACTPAHPRTTETAAGARDRLDSVEIHAVSASNLYDVVARLRPHWLRPPERRSFGLATEVVVYQDQMLLGGPDALRRIGAESAYSMRWLDGSTASNTLPGLGSRHVAGAIVVLTRPQ
jgi:hypothetical protein